MGAFSSGQEMNLGNVFITGAAGLIGGHLTEAVLKSGADKVVCLYRSTNALSYFSMQHMAGQLVLEPGDVRDAGRMREIITKHQITTVFHLAAQPLVTVALLNPLDTLHTNIMGTANVLEAARLSGQVRAVVVAASDKAYGQSAVPYHEDSPLMATHPYDVSKAVADQISRAYAATYDLPVAVVRSSNVYGPGDLNYDRLVPGIMRSILTEQELVLRSDGTLRRDYLYVVDAAGAYLAVANQLPTVAGESFNFGSDVNLQVKEVVRRIEEILNRRIPYRIENQAEYEIVNQSLDWNKAADMLGWRPAWNFTEAVKRTYLWYEQVLQPAERTVEV